jgi:hypothetical protein
MEKVRGGVRPNSRRLIGPAGRCASRPIKNCILELQSDAETSVREPLTINNSGKRPQVSHERPDYEPVVPLFGSSRKNANSRGANVLCGGSFDRRRVQWTGNLNWDL